MSYVPPPMRRIAAATQLLAAPPPYDPGPVFAQVPPDAWPQRGYQYTLTVQWSGVAVEGLAPITVRAHVHYRWQANGNQWVAFAGNAWISGVNDWQTATPAAVVAMAPAQPPNPDYHP